MVARYRSLLIKDVRRLLASSLLARLPLGMSTLAVLLLVRAHGGSFLLAGLAVGALTLASAASAPLQGALIDRVGQPRVLVPCAAGQGAALILLVVSTGAAAGWLIVLLAGVTGALTPPVSACLRVLWPRVVADARAREAAYALDAITQELIWVLGPMLVAGLAEVASSDAAVLAAAIITLLGNWLFLRCAATRSWRGGCHERRARRGALSSRALRSLLGSVALMGTMIGALQIGLPALATQLGSRGYAGVLLALLSAGSMAGGLLYNACRWRASVASRHMALLAALCLLIMPLLLVHSLLGGALTSMLAGLALAPIFSCQYLLVGALAPPGSVAEAFTWQTAALVAGIAAGSALGGALVDLGGAALPFLLGCGGAAVAFALAAAERRRLEPQALAALG